MSGFGDIIDQSTNLRTLAPAAVGSQVALMTVVSAATIVVFNVLRPRNKIVYEPKVKYHDGEKKPPPISDSLFGWVSPLLHTKEPVLVEKIGLDAAVFLRFLRMMRWLFTAVALLTCAVLIPINVVYNIRNVKSADRDVLSMLTIRDVNSRVLFVHVAATYVISFLVMAFVWKNWQEVISLRKQWFRSPEYVRSFYARTLMITQVPKKYQSDEGLRAIFESTGAPYPTTAVHIGRHVGRLPELIENHNEAVRELEAVLVRYLKDGKIAKERPTRRLGGWMCCGGRKVDAIDYYTAKLQKTERDVEDYRGQIDTRKAENYGFASMAAVPYAHIVANMLRRKRVKSTTITLAPNPKDIIWENLNKTPSEIRAKKSMGWIFLSAVCFFNTIPLFIISILANLASLTTFVPFLQDWSDSSPGSFTFISGVLPPAVSALFGFFLPIVMRWLSQYQGALTHSRLDRAVIARYFAFLVISQLIIFTLIGVVFNCVKEIVKQIGQHQNIHQILQNLNKLPGNIHKTYIDQSSYWLTYFPLRGFLVLFDLAQILNLVWISFKKHFLGRTPREIREWTQPPDFQYAIYFSNILLMGAVGFVFAPLAPLVVVAAAIVFWISSWVYKYQLMFVFVSRVETGGRLWNVVINRLLVSVALMQVLITLTMGFHFGFMSFYWIAPIPPVFMILAFKIYCTRTYNPEFNFYIPTEEELRMAHAQAHRGENASSRLGKRFGHPALHQELFTPMVHASMTALLREVYKGKLSKDNKLGEYAGSTVDIAGGIKFSGIEQHDLEYDPALYQRDRGDDWDARSVSSANLLASGKPDYPMAGRASPAPSKFSGYDRYLAQGSQQEIEMSRLNVDQVPLLTAPQVPGYFDPAASRSNVSLSTTYSPYHTPPLGGSPQFPPHVPQVPPLPATTPGQDYREASLHRPYPPRQQASGNAPPGEVNMAGRGAFRNY
ncbi:hypothetical protein PsYK624_075090 [Phanerochaete sordida]|uniref:DUF221-domain-containing protein n=1 Tax=Phanerochaete sordida TaxID=48140 RepID=A0A9P3LDK7_9APHY|nr:hypothetical protein PsYK624_075090 [Phanerochaete sordida]